MEFTLAISLAVALGVNVSKRLYTGKTSSDTIYISVFNCISGAFSALVLLAWGGFGEASLYTVLLGAAFGLIIVMQSVFFMGALRLGPMSYTNVIVSFSTLITALLGALFWNERITLLQIIGIILMLLSFVFAVEKDKSAKGASIKWLLFCMLAFLLTSGIGLLQKIHQSSEHKSELNSFLIIAFVVSSLLSLSFVLFAWIRNKPRAHLPAKKQKGLLPLLALLIAISGIMTAVNHKLNLYLSGMMDSAVFFPIVNGGSLILTTLAALIIFRERLSVRQWIGVGIGFLSVMLIVL